MILYVVYLAGTIPLLLYSEQIFTYIGDVSRTRRNKFRRLRWQNIVDSESSPSIQEDKLVNDKFALTEDEPDDTDM